MLGVVGQQCCVRLHGALVLPPRSSLFEPRKVGRLGLEKLRPDEEPHSSDVTRV